MCMFSVRELTNKKSFLTLYTPSPLGRFSTCRFRKLRWLLYLFHATFFSREKSVCLRSTGVFEQESHWFLCLLLAKVWPRLPSKVGSHSFPVFNEWVNDSVIHFTSWMNQVLWTSQFSRVCESEMERDNELINLLILSIPSTEYLMCEIARHAA